MNDPSKPFLIASSPSRSSRADSPGVFATGVSFAFVSPDFHASIHRCASVARASGVGVADAIVVIRFRDRRGVVARRFATARGAAFVANMRRVRFSRAY